MDDLDSVLPPDLRRVIRRAMKAAHARGRERGRAEAVAPLRFLSNMNGSVATFLKAWDESRHPRDHGKFAEKPGGSGDKPDQSDKPSGGGNAGRRRYDPDDHTAEDWEHAPSGRTGRRWRNIHTGKIHYGDKPPRGRAEGERRAWVERRREMLSRPAALEPGSEPRAAEWHDRTGMTPDELVAAADGLPGSRVSAYPGLTDQTLNVSISHPDVTTWRRQMWATADGELVLHNLAFFLRPKAQGGGLGTEAFVGQIRGCIEAGVSKVKTCAGRGTYEGVPMNGYATWPKMGYDAPLTKSQMTKLPPSLRGARTVLDLYETAEGEAWWREHGVTTAMTFDVSPGSRSLRKLNSYLESKGQTAVEYPAEKHRLNSDRQRDRVGRAGRVAAERRDAAVHDSYADRAGRAGFDAAEIRRAAESHSAAGGDLDAGYVRALQEAGERRFADRWESAGGVREWGRTFAESHGLDYAAVEHLARGLGTRDADLLNEPDADAAVRGAIIRAAQSIHYHKKKTEEAASG